MKTIALVYCILIFTMAPIIIAISPVIPVLIYNDDRFAWLMIVFVPCGLASAEFFWERALDWAFEKFEK